jgi:glutathione S-transferase
MFKLYIGNRNYSSWSLRGWLVAKLSGEPFEEVDVPLTGLTPNPANLAFSPSGLVPCLHEADIVVWDSMAIAGHLAERHPEMWPADLAARAWARSISAEMHAGFGALRSQMAMCIRERVDVRPWSKELAADIGRVVRVWDESRRRFGAGGAFLCGRFSIADCFYGPVAFRFQTYAVGVDGVAGAYLETLLAHPFMQEWQHAALAETTIIDDDEPRILYRDKIAASGGPASP